MPSFPNYRRPIVGTLPSNRQNLHMLSGVGFTMIVGVLPDDQWIVYYEAGAGVPTVDREHWLFPTHGAALAFAANIVIDECHRECGDPSEYLDRHDGPCGGGADHRCSVQVPGKPEAFFGGGKSRSAS